MSGVNKVILIGNLGQDPEMKFTQGGQAMLKLRLAVSEKWQDKQGEKQESTEWVSCTMWGKRAEALSKYLAKGSQVYVEGKLQTRSWDKDGEKRYATEVNVTNLEMLGGKRGGSHDERERPGQPPMGFGSGGGFGDDDIPFAREDRAW